MSMINDIDIQMLLCECALFYNENENEPAAAADDNDIDYLITVGEEEPSINISTFGSIESIFAEDDDSLLSFDFEEEEEETMQNTEEETIHNIDSIFNDDVSANKDKGEGSASNKHQFIGRAVTFEEEEELADGNNGSGTAKSNLKEIWDNKWKQRYDDLVVSTL